MDDTARTPEDVRMALEASIAARLAEDDGFRVALTQDPKTTLAPLIAEAAGDRVDLGAIAVEVAENRRDLLAVVIVGEAATDGSAEVEAYGGNTPLPYPDVGGGSGSGSGPKVKIRGGGKLSGGPSTVSGAVAKSIISSTNPGSAVPVPAVTVHFEGSPVSITGNPGFGNSM